MNDSNPAFLPDRATPPETPSRRRFAITVFAGLTATVAPACGPSRMGPATEQSGTGGSGSESAQTTTTSSSTDDAGAAPPSAQDASTTSGTTATTGTTATSGTTATTGTGTSTGTTNDGTGAGQAEGNTATTAPLQVRLRAAPPSVTGLLSPEAIRRVVLRNFGRFQSGCFPPGTPVTAALGGRIEVTFEIGSDGRVTQASTTRNSSGRPESGPCFADAVRALQFPSPERGTVRVMYPFNVSVEEAPVARTTTSNVGGERM